MASSRAATRSWSAISTARRSAAGFPPMTPPMRRKFSANPPGTSCRSSAFRAWPRWPIATTWYCAGSDPKLPACHGPRMRATQYPPMCRDYWVARTRDPPLARRGSLPGDDTLRLGGPPSPEPRPHDMQPAMTAPLKTIEGRDVAAAMREIGMRARAAARTLALAPSARKDAALAAIANAIRERARQILAANAEDLAEARAAGATAAFADRLALDAKRIEAMAAGVEVVRQLPDPVGTVTEAWTRPNGMRIERGRGPLRVIGVIYESRPNVTADAGALCLKAGNAAILRGGSEGFRSNRAIHAALAAGLEAAGLPEAAISLVPTRDRAAVGLMLSGLGGAIDVIVPRGGKGLVGRVPAEARVPAFAHLEGVCHVYVDKAADLAMAENIVLNAKMRRTGVCGAAEN